MYENEGKLTKGELNYIRHSILSSQQLLNIVRYNSLVDNDLMNCYLYVLGIQEYFITGKCRFLGNPGFTLDGYGNSLRWKINLLGAVKCDLKNLGLQYRILKHNNINLLENEYLIKAYIHRDIYSYFDDFHFMRYDPSSRLWFHKLSNNPPEIVKVSDDNLNKNSIFGREPDKFFVDLGGLYNIYKPVGYIAIKELKKTK